MNQIKGIGSIPTPAKGAMLLLAGLGLGSSMWMLQGKARLVILLGLAFLALLFPLYKMIKKRADSKRGAMLTAGVGENAKAAPLGISDPARRAKLDELRKKFEEGVKVFEQYGKNLYALPWYIVVGEPGSGKTEAIRHCNVGFPPGLQDQLQGAGGTLNMNWWFTNGAIFLDTAGRLMFEEVAPGATSEWQEFLKLLKKVRPNCPINGMLLVIPSDSLIKDSADVIERKGGRIAQQLDAIQRTLGVRFPVFVVVTKCDLINGFREFFDDLTDPTLQHQIMGWSNPGELDTPFNPDQVDQHLKAVQERLQRRRLNLMIDPVHSEDPQRGKRIDQIDAMFGFPEAFLKIAPRLSSYLRMVFVAGAWSQKPLFLRGIYFTSSMREGEALDAEIAEAMGMPIESLPEGRLWEKERAAFLRDVFLSKVFMERGLVTSAVNAGKHIAKQRRMLYGFAAAGALLFGAATWFGYRSLNEKVVDPSERIRGAASAFNGYRQPSSFWGGAPGTYKLPIVRLDEGNRAMGFFVWEQPLDKSEWTPQGQPGGESADFDLATRRVISRELGETPLDAVLKLKDVVGAKINVPAALYPVAMVFGKLDADQSAVFADRARILLEDSVLRPAFDAARARIEMDIENADWSEETTAGLRELLKLELAHALAAEGQAVGEEFKPDIAALLSCAARPLPGDASGVRRVKVQNLVLFDGRERLLYADRPEDAKSNPRLTLIPDKESVPRTPRIKGINDLIATLFFTGAASAWPPESLRVSSDWPAGEGKGLLERAAIGFREYWSPSRGGDVRELLGLATLVEAMKAYNVAERKLVQEDFKPTFADESHAGEVARWNDLCKNLGEARRVVDESIAVLPPKTALSRAYADAKGQFTKGRDAAFASLRRELGTLDRLKKPTAPAESLRRFDARLGAPPSATEGFESDAVLDELDAALVGAGETRAFAARWEAFYDPATRLLADAEAASAEDAGSALPAFSQRVAERAAEADRAMSNFGAGTPDQPSRMALAARVSKQAMLLAKRGYLGRVIESELARGRPSADSLAAAATQGCEGETVSVPEWPLQSRPSFESARYCPRGAGSVLAKFATIEQHLLLRNRELAGASAGEGVPVVLGSRALSDRFRSEIEPAATAFLLAYRDFWTRDFARRVENTPEWALFAQRVQTGNPAASVDPVKTMLQSAADALKRAAAAPGAGSPTSSGLSGAIAGVEATLRSLAQATPDAAADARGRGQQWQTVFNAWKGLSQVSDAVKARELAMRGITDRPADWLFELAPSLAADGLQDPVSEYRRSFVIAAIRALTNDAVVGMQGEVRRARESLGFPIRRGSGQATEREVDSLRKALAGLSAEGGQGQRPPIVSDPQFNEPLADLFRGPSLSAEQKAWAEAIARVLAGLPPLDTQFRGVIVLPKGNFGARASFSFVRMFQGDDPGGGWEPFAINQQLDINFDKFQYPSSRPITIELRRAGAGAADGRLVVDGPWGILQLLQAAGGEAVRLGELEGPNGSRRWEVDVPVQAEGKTEKVRMHIVLERALPEPRSWWAN